jgi:hypothetical protein
MSLRMLTALSCTILGAVIAPSDCSARLVRVAYEGSVDVVGWELRGSFAAGDRIWGEYVYDDSDPASVLSWLGSEHPAIRRLSLNSGRGFAGSVNYGVISIPGSPSGGSTYNRPLMLVADLFRLTSVSLSAPSYGSGGGPFHPNGIADDIDSDGHFGPDGFDSESPVRDPDSIFIGDQRGDFDDLVVLPWHMPYRPQADLLTHAAQKAIELGFPPASGAFGQGRPFAVDLFLYEGELDWMTAAQPRLLSDFQSASRGRGVMNLGASWTSSGNQVEFDITRIEIVPEPATVVAAVITTIPIISFGRRRRPTS